MIWHLPWIYDTALENPHSLLHLEHALYFLTGVAMWWSVLQDEPHRLSAGPRAGVVLGAFVLGSPIGLVIALVPNAIYDFYVEAHHRLWGLDPLEDQQLAGIGMIDSAAMIALKMLFVTETAVLERPSAPETPLLLIASRTFSTIW